MVGIPLQEKQRRQREVVLRRSGYFAAYSYDA